MDGNLLYLTQIFLENKNGFDLNETNLCTDLILRFNRLLENRKKVLKEVTEHLYHLKYSEKNNSIENHSLNPFFHVVHDRNYFICNCTNHAKNIYIELRNLNNRFVNIFIFHLFSLTHCSVQLKMI